MKCLESTKPVVCKWPLLSLLAVALFVDIQLSAQPVVSGNVGGSVNSTYQFAIDDFAVCRPSPDSVRAPISIFPKEGPFYFDEPTGTYVFREPTTACARFLGEYDQGVRVGSNNGALRGKYVKTGVLSYYDVNPGSGVYDVPSLYDAENDFRVEYVIGDLTPPRESAIWLSETNAYYHITEYTHNNFVPMIRSIGLDPEREFNLTMLGYRPDLPGFNPDAAGVPLHVVREDYSDGPFQIVAEENLTVAPVMTRLGGQRGVLPPLSYSYDSAFTVGEYIGLRAFALPEASLGFPSEFGFGSGWTGLADMSPVLNDALNLWVAYDYSGETEVAKNFWYSVRRWPVLLYPGDPERIICDQHAEPSCLSGNDIDSSMMYHANISDRDSIFPPRTPSNFVPGMGANDADLAAIYVANIFYEISRYLGKREAGLIFLKTLSMLDLSMFGALDMNEFGRLILSANDALEVYRGESHGNRRVIERVLEKKGIAHDTARPNIEDYLPASIGSYPESLKRDSSNKFGSSFPESQPTVDNDVSGPGSFYYFTNEYFITDTHNFGLGVQLWEGSRYGPCDYLAVTDGSFVDSEYQQDGTFYKELRGRGLENAVIIAPGSTIRWMRYREKCYNYQDGDYTNDFRPAGFRAVKATLNGYSFKVRKISETPFNIRYELEVVDPFVSSIPNFVSVDYSWLITDMTDDAQEIAPQTSNASRIEVSLPKNQAVNIVLNREAVVENMGTYIEIQDSLEIMDSVNLLDRSVDGRPAGEAFVIDLSQ